MPIVTRLSRNLSPLEEEPQCRGASGDGEGESVFVGVGTSILTTRSCEPKDGRQPTDNHKRPPRRPLSVQECEVFLPVTEQTLPSMESQMQYLWSQGVPMCIEVKGQATPPAGVASSEDLPSVLLEQWLIQVLPRRPHSSPHTTPLQLTQAVSSFLHFSQIRSWVVSNDGSLPFDLVYRVCDPGEENWEQFALCEPEKHIFPAAVLSPHSALHVSVTYLPRLDHIPAILVADGTKQFRRKQQVSTQPSNKPQGTNKFIPKATSIPDHLIQKTSSLKISRDLPTSSTSSSSFSSKTSVTSREAFPFSPPLPSPMSPKLLSGLGDKLLYHSFTQKALTQGEERRTSASRGHTANVEDAGGSEMLDELSNCSHKKSFCFERMCVEQGYGKKSGWDGEAKKMTASQEACSEGSLRCNQGEKRGGGCRHAQLLGHSSGVAETSGSPPRMRVRPPAASSPIPFVVNRSNSENKHTCNLQAHRRSCVINTKHPVRPLLRSNSAPAIVPSLYLLGTFEESMLNGRLEPCGYVEGFTAEVGASGSFCPQHITLPVTAAFFSLSDDGPSPYLGHIDLTGVGKRGYHVPRKGTVQVTLFNPNKTVVKIFIVTFDFSDMPPNSQTFLRQKTLSRPCHTSSDSRGIPAIHYLIHLRFLCSKSGRVYLHTDIRLIFARRAPDTDPDRSKVTLTTITEGPSEPEYGPLEARK